MKNAKRKLALGLAALLIAGTGSCGSARETEATQASVGTNVDPNAEYTEAIDFDEMASQIQEVDTKNEEGAGPKYESGKLAGDIEALCYYIIEDETPALSVIFAERFGGTVKTGTRDPKTGEFKAATCSSDIEYFDMLSERIMADLSPDLVRYDSPTFPYGIYHNLYEPLDEWLDMDSPVWSSMKGAIERYQLNGKHYYYPQELLTRYVVLYNRESIREADLPDPMDLLDAGEWTWDAFEDMMKKWCARGPEYTGVGGAQWSALTLANSTGTLALDFSGGQITNNLRDPNIQRTMEWVQSLYDKQYIYTGWIHPNEVFNDGKRLFEIMGDEWGFTEAQKGMFASTKDFDKSYDFAFVPMPKDPQADKYYLSGESAGYLVPRGAKNIQGAVSYILCSRIYETDPEVIAADRAELMDKSPIYADKCTGKTTDADGKSVKCGYNYKKSGTLDLLECPDCGTPRLRLFKPAYDERQLDVLYDFQDPDKYTVIFDASYGLGSDFEKIFINADPPQEALYDGPFYYGTSYTELREQYYNTIEYYLQHYRDILSAG